MEDLTPLFERLDRIEALVSGPKVTPEYLSTPEAAVFTGLSPMTLEQWRSEGKGPTYCRVGRAVRYSVQDLRAFMDTTKEAQLR